MHSLGLIVPENLSFAEIIAPLVVELAPCYWIVDILAGDGEFIFDWNWRQSSQEHLKQADDCTFKLPCQDWRFTCCCRPGTFLALAAHVEVCEWSYFAAVRCGNVEAESELTRLCKDDFGSDPWYEQMKDEVDLFLCWPDQYWETYSRHDEWNEKLRAAHPSCYDRPPNWRKN